ncbi:MULTISPECIES: ACT domain-containing protein [unclassified Arthrobacter]|uniref:ACT domain-containing protein n=1 Tax=unclassified Arthrobacter TaxID=235627 RepID=UPI001D1490B4|nr:MULTISPECIES: ACT domain-containing protein [unclassified Arthrobacter]MCC3275957.1 ACT domain-containing protein [Arthrobacter sp. zg-Y20]MCC3278063.1 ACT domain-containing protein [Arthrobacter sp. zg-Y40]MCC9176458.1 ACT domain-containing protein [Arthrobacter sp. zg-Y750]MDK1316114.1 ACT domain-containing protein [Arthrobacter sp. zg.Y20]WIB05597.1 ACT domain-containing protein [Arthrobacter sp. zg-Y20]
MTLPAPAPSVELHVLAGNYVIARLSPAAEAPAGLLAAAPPDGFVSITRTPQELSIVCPAALAPADAEIDGTWAALYASGPIPFGLTGVVASLVAPLSAAGCPVFVVSTFDGDILMVPSPQFDQARDLLRAAGHTLP